jgi:MFS family permease
MSLPTKHRRYMMWVVMYLMFMTPGMWVPSLPNILQAHGARWALPYTFALMPICTMCSALLFGALSDRKLHAENLLAALGLSGAVFLWLAFYSLERGWHPGWYVCFQGGNALLAGPMFSLMTKIKLVHLPNAAKSLPLYSIGGTVGWLSGGCLVSWCALDQSATTGQWAAYVRLLMSSLCFLLPTTPPTDHQSEGWKAALGLTAFKLLKIPELRVFYLTATLFAIPCVSFYMLVPTMLQDFGSTHPAAHMTLAQVAEVVAMLGLSVVAGRFRLRWLLIVGLALGVARFALFALAGELGLLALVWLGIALHGPIYTFTAVAGRIFLDQRVPSTMRGQGQALYQLLSCCVAGAAGSFFCEFVYQQQVSGAAGTWGALWLILTAIAIIPLLYFLFAVIDRSARRQPDPKVLNPQ